MKVTVVTVCFNALNDLEKTFSSVQNQTYKDIQHVIIDGASKDGSVEYIEKYKQAHSDVLFISEPDTGIYNAMNKSIGYAEGEYIFFLNAGDVFYDDTVIENFVSAADERKDIYFGNVLTDNGLWTYSGKLSLFDLIWKERMICHQSIFAKKELLEKISFDDESYKICADRVWLINSLKNGASYKHLSDLTVAYYNMDGVSSTSPKFRTESLDIGKQYGGFPAVIFIKIKRLAGKILKH